MEGERKDERRFYMLFPVWICGCGRKFPHQSGAVAVEGISTTDDMWREMWSLWLWKEDSTCHFLCAAVAVEGVYTTEDVGRTVLVVES